jgi:hypothetical protein
MNRLRSGPFWNLLVAIMNCYVTMRSRYVKVLTTPFSFSVILLWSNPALIRLRSVGRLHFGGALVLDTVEGGGWRVKVVVFCLFGRLPVAAASISPDSGRRFWVWPWLGFWTNQNQKDFLLFLAIKKYIVHMRGMGGFVVWCQHCDHWWVSHAIMSNMWLPEFNTIRLLTWMFWI